MQVTGRTYSVDGKSFYASEPDVHDRVSAQLYAQMGEYFMKINEEGSIGYEKGNAIRCWAKAAFEKDSVVKSQLEEEALSSDLLAHNARKDD